MPKKGKDAKAEPPPPPTKEELEKVLTLIYREITKVRSQIVKIERINEQLRDKLLEFENDRSDLTLYLNRNLEAKTNILAEVQEQCKEVGKLRDGDKKELSNKLKDLELKFKNTRITLIGEINILRSKLDSLEEFRAQRDKFMAHLGNQEKEFNERDRRGKEELFNIQRKNMIDRDNLRKEIEYKTEQLMEDFEKTNEIRIAGYSRKLIRENIALTRTLGKMMIQQSSLEVQHKEIKKRYKDLIDKYSVNDINLKRLERTCHAQVDIKDKIETKLATIKTAHFGLLTFKTLYEKSFDDDLNCKNKVIAFSKKSENLGRSMKLMNIEKDKLGNLIKSDEDQIYQLQEKIKAVKAIVNAEITKKMAPADKLLSLREKDNQRKQFLQVLTELLSSEELFKEPRADISAAVLEPAELPQKSREEILEILKPSQVEVKVKIFKELENIIPEPLHVASDLVLSAVSGTPLILSSSEESLPPIEDEGGMGEAEDFGASSSESAAGMPEEPEEKAPSEEVISEKSVASISVTEYLEEEDYLYEDYGEEDA